MALPKFAPPKLGSRAPAPVQEEEQIPSTDYYNEDNLLAGGSDVASEFDVEDEGPRQLTKPSKWRWSDGKKATPEVIAGALRTMAMMMRTGATEIEAVSQTGEELNKYQIGKRLQHATVNMRDEAATFQEALNNIDVIPRQAKELINAAATATEIQRNLRRAARQITEGRAVRKEIQSQFYEPGFTLVMAIVALFIIVYYALPIAISQFETIGVDNPWMIDVLIVASDIMIWAIGGFGVSLVVGAGFWFLFGKRSAKVRTFVDRTILRLPAIGPVMQYSSTARLFDLLAVGLESGLTEPKALVAAGRGCGNEAMRAHCDEHARQMVTGDETLGNLGRTTKIIPDTASFMLAQAPSQPAQIEIMTHYVEEYEDEYKRRLDALTKILPPLIQYPVYALVSALVVLAVMPLILMTTEMTEIQP